MLWSLEKGVTPLIRLSLNLYPFLQFTLIVVPASLHTYPWLIRLLPWFYLVIDLFIGSIIDPFIYINNTEIHGSVITRAITLYIPNINRVGPQTSRHVAVIVYDSYATSCHHGSTLRSPFLHSRLHLLDVNLLSH